MGIFDDDDDIDAGGGGLRADPDALVDFLDSAAESAQSAYESATSTAQQVAYDAVGTAEQYAADVAQRAEDDPMGLANDFVTTAGSIINPMAPQVEVDTTDGISVKMSNLVGEGGFSMHDDGHVVGDLTATAGPLGGLDAHLVTDADGNVTKASGGLKVSIEDVGVDAKGAYEETADGYKASGEYGVHAPIEGVPVAMEVRGGYEDLGEHGYSVTGGASGGLYAEGAEGFVEGTAMAGFDVDYSTVDGQETIGLRENIELGAEIAGQDVGEAKVERGIAYTTGPDGDRIITHEQGSVTLGTEETNVSGTIRTQHEYGTDAQGNEVDRTTDTMSGSVTIPEAGVDVSTSSTAVYDNPDLAPIEADVYEPPSDGMAEWDAPAGLDATYDEAAEANAPVDNVYVDPAETWAESEPLVLEEPVYDSTGSTPMYEDTAAAEPVESYDEPEAVSAESYSE